MTQPVEFILESLLFVSKDPLSINQMKKVISGSDTQKIRQALQRLAEAYETRKGSFFLTEVAGGFQLRTRPEYREWVKRLIQPPAIRLSRAAMETLAIVAYKQPVIRADLEHIRGVDSGGILRMLLERKLIRILGRKKIPGRPLIYATTHQFLELFDLKNLTELPTPKEIEALGNDMSEKIDSQPDQIVNNTSNK